MNEKLEKVVAMLSSIKNGSLRLYKDEADLILSALSPSEQPEPVGYACSRELRTRGPREESGGGVDEQRLVETIIMTAGYRLLTENNALLIARAILAAPSANEVGK